MKRAVFLLLLLTAAAPAQGQQPRVPIPGPLDGPLPRYQGKPAAAQPLHGPWNPVNPDLAPDGRSGSGLAPGNGAASPYPGPLGRGTTGLSSLQFGTCNSLAFDAKDRLLALCNGPSGPSLRLIEPTSLDTLATLVLPPRRGPDRSDLGGGTHLLVRADGSVLVPTNDSTLVTVAVEGNSLRQTGSVALPERPFAVARGFDGLDWVVSAAGTVFAIGPAGTKSLALREPVTEDIATDPSGTFVVTRDALYRLKADKGVPKVVWRHTLPTGVADPGRIHTGSGTPPAIVARDHVAVADGISRVDVFRIRGGARTRLRCAVPVFDPGAVETHLVVAGRGIVVANSHGYTGPARTEGGNTTTGGIARVVVGKRGCRTVWTNPAPSPTPQAVVSRTTGLLYTLVKPRGFPDAWNLAAIDWRSGATRFEVLAGEGLGHNPEGGALALGPDGAAYAGTFGGVIRFGDAR